MIPCACSLRSTHCAALIALAAAAAQTSRAAVQTDPAVSTGTEVVTLERFEIVGTRPHATDTTALKLSATVLDTPRSVTVFDQSRLQEQDIQTGSDLLPWIPGLSTNGAVTESYHYYARGYRMGGNDWRIDGVAGRVVSGSYSPNLFGVEQVTVLRGPAGLLYGSSVAPGGMINLTTKKPQDRPLATVETRIRTSGGNETRFGERWSHELEFDFTGPLVPSRRLTYRLLASLERSSLAGGSSADDNQFYRAAFTYHLDQQRRFQITPMFEWSREDRAQRSPTLSPASSRSTNDGKTNYTLMDASPRSINLAAGGRIDRNQIGGLDFAARFSPAWEATISLRHSHRAAANNAFAINSATLSAADPADARSWTVTRRHLRARNTYATTSVDAATSYEFSDSPNFRSRLQLGLTGRRNVNSAASSGNGPDQSPVNIYTGAAARPLVANAPTLAPGNRSDVWTWNAFAQNQTQLFGRTILTTGFALARETSRATAPTGVVFAPPPRRSGLTPNVALVRKLSRSVSLYASYSTSYAFADPTFEDASGRTGAFKPSEGSNYEAGAKAAFWGNLLAASFSVFDTAQNGVFVQSQANELNVRGNRFYRQLDNGRTSRGVETEFTVSPIPAWDTTVAYAYLDARDHGATAAAPNSPAELTPRHAVSAYSRYAVLRGPLQGLSLRAGVIWQSERWSAVRTAAAPDPLLLSAFHRIDAGVGYQRLTWRWSLHVENLTNENYLLAGATGLAFSQANPRSYTLRVGRSW